MAGKIVGNEVQVPFHPAPSIGHEIGIMLGFMAFFVLSMGVYYVFWRGRLSLLRTENLPICSPIYNLNEESCALLLGFFFCPSHLTLFPAQSANVSVKL